MNIISETTCFSHTVAIVFSGPQVCHRPVRIVFIFWIRGLFWQIEYLNTAGVAMGSVGPDAMSRLFICPITRE